MDSIFTLSSPLFLGSNSPRRKEILSSAGFSFTVLPADIDESFDEKMPLELVPKFLAEEKAKALQESIQTNAFVLTADTVVIVGDKILNKPTDRKEAFQMLKAISGKTHRVVTGYSIQGPGISLVDADIAEVTFRNLEDWEIEFYVKSGSALDKAGAYGIQDFIGMVGIEKLEGSFYTVMGLPIYKVYHALKPFILEGRDLIMSYEL
jgi:septum formation protein